MNYKDKIYQSYRTAFKGGFSEHDLAFGARKLRPIIEPWVSAADRKAAVVDLGCGAGELLWAFKELGFENLQGVDISEEQATAARAFFPQVKTGDIFGFLSEAPEKSFEIITLFDVIEHLTRQSTFDLLELIHSRLKPGGMLIAHVPNGLSPFVGQVFWGDMTHEWCLTPDSAATLCRLHGFVKYDVGEHVGASNNLKGCLRGWAWSCIRFGLRVIDAIETGSTSRKVWTRCFVFKAVKP